MWASTFPAVRPRRFFASLSDSTLPDTCGWTAVNQPLSHPSQRFMSPAGSQAVASACLARPPEQLQAVHPSFPQSSITIYHDSPPTDKQPVCVSGQCFRGCCSGQKVGLKEGSVEQHQTCLLFVRVFLVSAEHGDSRGLCQVFFRSNAGRLK